VVDHLVAGTGYEPDLDTISFLDRELSAWTDLVQRNVMTMMRCSHHFARRMRARGRGGVLLINSGACYGGGSGMGPYCGSKAFTLCFAEALWAELRHQGVDVLNLILGRTDTPAHRRLMERNGQPIPEGMAKPEDVAEIGLSRLAHGPDYNWGQDDDTVGYAPNSPAQRRARIIAIEEMSKAYTGSKS